MNSADIHRQHRAALGAPHIWQARSRGELLTISEELTGNTLAYCDYHLRLDNVIVIYAIAVSKVHQRRGYGKNLLEQLKAMKPVAIIAKCPVLLPANDWYTRMGFRLINIEGANLNVWRLDLPPNNKHNGH